MTKPSVHTIRLEKSEGRKPYVASIAGHDRKWRLSREFLEPDKTTRKGKVLVYRLPDGLYEVGRGAPREDLAVVRARPVDLDRDEVFRAVERVGKASLSMAHLFEAFCESRRSKAPESLLKIATKLVNAAKPPKRKLPDAASVDADTVFAGSSPTLTRHYLRALENRGDEGRIAAMLFRAQKSSTRAKMYYRRTYKDLAYDRKGDCLKALCELLAINDCGIRWGWGTDAKEQDASDVLYVDLPTGQASFHSPDRHVGPEYPGEWDTSSDSMTSVLTFCDQVMQAPALPLSPDR